MKHYIPIILLLLLCGCKTKPETKASLMEVDVFQAESQNVPRTMEFVGKTYSNYDISVQPRVSGFLASANYSNGMPVKKGQLIFTIDPSQISTDLEQARANKLSAQAQLVKARNDYKRAIPLAEINALSQLNLDQYRAEYFSAEAADKAAEAAMRNAELNLGYTNIYSPIDGIIAESSASIGDYVGSNTQFAVLTKISNIDTITCNLQIPVSDYLEYRNSEGISSPTFENDSLLSNITLFLSDGSQYHNKGFYMYTKKDIGQDMGVIVLVVGFHNLEFLLKVGQYAKVRADVGGSQNVVMVPQRAVSQTQGINSLWVMKPDSTVEYRQVVLGSTIGNMWVVESGLDSGEKVLTQGTLKVRKGMKVKPRMVSNTPSVNGSSNIANN